MQHIYSPEKIKYFIDYNYVSSRDFTELKEIFYMVPFYNYYKGIPNMDITRLVYFEYDSDNQIWNIYRNNKESQFIDNQNCLQYFSSDYSYMCYITEESVEILFTISNENNYIDIVTNNFINHDGIINDCGYITSNGRILMLNSSNPIDMIFSYLRFGYDRLILSDLLNIMTTDDYYVNIEKCLNNLRKDLDTLKKTPPIKNYTNIFKLSMYNDINYHLVKYDMFHGHVTDVVNNLCPTNQFLIFKNMFSFFRNLRNDIILEILYTYNRFRSFPHERIALYKIHGEHPILCLLKYIYNQSKVMNKKVTYEFISYLINDNACVTIYDEFGTLLINALSYRSDLFSDFFKEFLKTEHFKIRPKYNNNSNFFPIKRYSSTLFVIEHLLKMYL